jgi:hypothetical protein
MILTIVIGLVAHLNRAPDSKHSSRSDSVILSNKINDLQGVFCTNKPMGREWVE